MIQCSTVCNPGFKHNRSVNRRVKTVAKCLGNRKKFKYQWTPGNEKNFAQCIPDKAFSCESVPNGDDLTFFLLQNTEVHGIDGYSDDDENELLAMFSGR